MEKYVLCRPRGGLNDILCEIERCWAYSEKYNRTLVVDTTKSGFRDDLSKYFEVKDQRAPVVLSLDTDLINAFNKMTAYPPALAGQIKNYEVRWNYDWGGFEHTITGERTQFSLTKTIPNVCS
ncbi:MAG: hypothetical protein CTY31_03855 [Hyphomicrobium sp.]|nr:MAG: hypothetical protein CTY39_00770 [Hyphomicrobium sp.]PPD01871.1 MAG: hypothetical protein CTY31_03855 [Hyphomicrobium sp.]